MLPGIVRGLDFADRWTVNKSKSPFVPIPRESMENPLRDYFECNKTGKGIWKWNHYFEIYHRHLASLRGREINLLEIGIYSGGSLEMWRQYLGEECTIFGVDIEETCRRYESDRTKIFIGDQQDRKFWDAFQRSTPAMDIIIDDGGHSPEQQMVTLEELLPNLNPGGVYICEDIHGRSNPFISFATSIVQRLNANNLDGNGGVETTPVQSSIHSIHFYPFMLVIEKNTSPVDRLVAPKNGTEWSPFPGL